MDLFGRKAKRALAVSAGRLVTANAQQIYSNGLIDKLLASNAQLQQELTLAKAQLAKAEEALTKPMRAGPLYKNEDQEELEFALQNGQIDLSEFRHLMAQQGFDNHEVELPELPPRKISY